MIYHDLIGFKVYAKRKSKPLQSDFIEIGVVMDDTHNMFITKKDNQLKKYIKKDHVFRFALQECMLEVDGEKVVGNPENRLRSLKKKNWRRK